MARKKAATGAGKRAGGRRKAAAPRARAGAGRKAKAAPKKRNSAAAAAPPISLEEFRAIPAFSGMSAKEAGVFLDLMVERPVARGEPILVEGETGDGLFVVLQGRVRISKRNAKGGEREVAVLEKHEVFGEMDLISDRPHTAGAKGAASSHPK